MLRLLMSGLIALLCKALTAALESARKRLLTGMRTLMVYEDRAPCEASLARWTFESKAPLAAL
jgi:hypothetical protein